MVIKVFSEATVVARALTAANASAAGPPVTVAVAFTAAAKAPPVYLSVPEERVVPDAVSVCAYPGA